MKKEYMTAQIAVIDLEAEDIVTNSLPWLSGSKSFNGDIKNLFWSNEDKGANE